MVQGGGGSGLVNETPLALAVDRGVTPEELEGDRPAEARIDGTIHRAHATFAEQLHYLVMRDRLRA
jgi:hypothetical protein